MTDAAMEMVAHELEDKQRLRRALSQLVETCRLAHPDSQALAPALLFAQAALDDTSHEGWLRRMLEQRERSLADRFAECQRNGRHLQTRWSSDEPPQCTHCERLVDLNTPEGLR